MASAGQGGIDLSAMVRGVCLAAVLALAGLACDPEDAPDGGSITHVDAGLTLPDSGTDPVDAGVDAGTFPDCFWSGGDRLISQQTALRSAPSTTAGIVQLLAVSSRIIPIYPDDGGIKTCQDQGYLWVQFGTERGYVLTVNTSDATCHQGSSFDGGIDGFIQEAFSSQGAAAQASAVKIAQCESGVPGTHATNVNGDLFGLFQLTPLERSTYGDSLCAESQSTAAFAVYQANGDSFSRWSSCPP